MKQKLYSLDKIYPNRRKKPKSNRQDTVAQLRTKLKTYAAASGVLLAATSDMQEAYATIQHSGTLNQQAPVLVINPTIGYAGSFGTLDLDNDGSSEIRFALYQAQFNCTSPSFCNASQQQHSTYLRAVGLGFNSFTTTINTGGGGTTSTSAPLGFFAGNAVANPFGNVGSLNQPTIFNTSANIASIDSNNGGSVVNPAMFGRKTTTSNGNVVASGGYHNFFNASTPQCGFIGFTTQLTGDASTVNGWIQIRVNPNSNGMTIVDFAYEDSGVAILAGDTGAGGVQALANCEIPPNDIPTLSEWGLITLALFLMTFGTLYIVRREETLAGIGSGQGSKSSWQVIGQRPPFDWRIFRKTALGTAILAAIAGMLTFAVYGSIAAVDIFGTAIAGPLFAYLAHLIWLYSSSEEE